MRRTGLGRPSGNEEDMANHRTVSRVQYLRRRVTQTLNIQRGLVGAIGFEPTTPCAQGRCATRLRYAPTLVKISSDYS